MYQGKENTQCSIIFVVIKLHTMPSKSMCIISFVIIKNNVPNMPTNSYTSDKKINLQEFI